MDKNEDIESNSSSKRRTIKTHREKRTEIILSKFEMIKQLCFIVFIVSWVHLIDAKVDEEKNSNGFTIEILLTEDAALHRKTK